MFSEVPTCASIPFLHACRDEVLLEVTFAAIWLAVAHRAHRRAQQQHMLSAQRLKEATLLLVKWLLFRLLLLTSSFSATYLCGPDPGLSSCWKTLLAHGLPHAATRWDAARLLRP